MKGSLVISNYVLYFSPMMSFKFIFRNTNEYRKFRNYKICTELCKHVVYRHTLPDDKNDSSR